MLIFEDSYEGRPESPTDAHVFRATMATELQQWKESLPTSLHVNISKDWRANEIKLYLPMVLQLQYVLRLLSTLRT